MISLTVLVRASARDLGQARAQISSHHDDTNGFQSYSGHYPHQNTQPGSQGVLVIHGGSTSAGSTFHPISATGEYLQTCGRGPRMISLSHSYCAQCQIQGHNLSQGGWNGSCPAESKSSTLYVITKLLDDTSEKGICPKTWNQRLQRKGESIECPCSLWMFVPVNSPVHRDVLMLASRPCVGSASLRFWS